MVRSRRLYPLGLLGVLACSTEPGAPPPPPPPPSQLQVDPPQIVLTAGTSFQFSALKSGRPVPVVWSLDQPGAGTITQEGLFTHAYCHSGPVQVRARLASDPAVSGIGAAQIAYIEPAFTALRSIELSNGQAARLDSLAGTVNLVAMMAARPYPCRAIRKLRFGLVLGLDVMAVDSALSILPWTRPTSISSLGQRPRSRTAGTSCCSWRPGPTAVSLPAQHTACRSKIPESASPNPLGDHIEHGP